MVSQGTLASATYSHDLAAFYQQLGIRQFGMKHPISQLVQPNCSSGCIPPAHSLSVAQIPQLKTYYCGPGSAEAVLNFLGYDTAQSTLANSSYLNTDNNGGTNYGSNVFAPTLNGLGNTGGFYAQKNVSSLSVYESDMTSDIAQSWPVVAAVHESSAYELNTTENGWYHWFDVSGYTGTGYTSNYVDPAHGIWSVPATGNTLSSQVQGMMSYGGFGYIW